MEEIWKDIEGYEGLYQVSSLGRVKSLNYNKTGKEVILRQDHKYGDENNYCRIVLKQKHYLVHTLVAFAFPEICGEWFEGAVVNHKNEIKTDNRAENLEWCTQKENTIYGTGTKRRVESFRERTKDGAAFQKRLQTLAKNGSTRAKIPVIISNGTDEKHFDSLSDAAKYIGCEVSRLTVILHGRGKTVYGYKIKRAG